MHLFAYCRESGENPQDLAGSSSSRIFSVPIFFSKISQTVQHALLILLGDHQRSTTHISATQCANSSSAFVSCASNRLMNPYDIPRTALTYRCTFSIDGVRVTIGASCSKKPKYGFSSDVLF